MSQNSGTQALAGEIAAMDRTQVIAELLCFEGSVKLDFTEEFLSSRSLEQLKHILLAARLHLTYGRQPD